MLARSGVFLLCARNPVCGSVRVILVIQKRSPPKLDTNDRTCFQNAKEQNIFTKQTAPLGDFSRKFAFFSLIWKRTISAVLKTLRCSLTAFILIGFFIEIPQCKLVQEENGKTCFHCWCPVSNKGKTPSVADSGNPAEECEKNWQ